MELLGRSVLIGSLLRDGVEVASPLRDRGIDLIAYVDLAAQHTRFRSCPIQMKSSIRPAFSISRKYAKISDLLIVHVWHADRSADPEIYATTQSEAVAIGDRMGWTKTASWKHGGKYYTSAPSARLRAHLREFKIERGGWRKCLFRDNPT